MPVIGLGGTGPARMAVGVRSVKRQQSHRLSARNGWHGSFEKNFVARPSKSARRRPGSPWRSVPENHKQFLGLARSTDGTDHCKKIFALATRPAPPGEAGTKRFSKHPCDPCGGDFPMPVIGLGGTDAARTARQPPRPRPTRRTSLSPPEWPAMAAPGPALAPLKAPPGGAPPPRQGHPG